MKINEIRVKLTNATLPELQEMLEMWRRDLFSLQLNATTTHIKDYSQFSKVKKNIARTLTCIQRKVNEI